MKRFITLILPRSALNLLQDARSFIDWRKRKYAAPSPPPVKRQVLLRSGISNATWVETGTYCGDTTAFLARRAKHVYTIEPGPALYQKAKSRFKDSKNVSCIQGLSEKAFVDLLPKLSGNVNFWLDGHFSLGVTFKGPKDTPIVEELRLIEQNIAKYENLAVFVDDVRCFDPSIPEYREYPRVTYLLEWAERNGMIWRIEHDIFMAFSNKKKIQS